MGHNRESNHFKFKTIVIICLSSLFLSSCSFFSNTLKIHELVDWSKYDNRQSKDTYPLSKLSLEMDHETIKVKAFIECINSKNLITGGVKYHHANLYENYRGLKLILQITQSDDVRSICEESRGDNIEEETYPWGKYTVEGEFITSDLEVVVPYISGSLHEISSVN